MGPEWEVGEAEAEVVSGDRIFAIGLHTPRKF